MTQTSIDGMQGVETPRGQKRRVIKLTPGDVVDVQVKSLGTFARKVSFKGTPEELVTYVVLRVEENSEECVLFARQDSYFGKDLIAVFPKLEGKRVQVGKKAIVTSNNRTCHRLVYKIISDEDERSGRPESTETKPAAKAEARSEAGPGDKNDLETRILAILRTDGPQERVGLAETLGVDQIDLARALKGLVERGEAVTKDGWVSLS